MSVYLYGERHSAAESITDCIQIAHSIFLNHYMLFLCHSFHCLHILSKNVSHLLTFLQIYLLYFIIYYWSSSLASCPIPPAFQSLCFGILSKLWPQPERKIMQPDNASRQSITLMASTMMPVRFQTNFKLLKTLFVLWAHYTDSAKRVEEITRKCPKKTKRRLPVFCFQACKTFNCLLLLVFISLSAQ